MVGCESIRVEPTNELNVVVEDHNCPSSPPLSSVLHLNSAPVMDFCDSLLNPIVPDASCGSQGLVDCDVEGFLQAACMEDFELSNLESLLASC